MGKLQPTLNKDGLAQFWDIILNNFATKDDLNIVSGDIDETQQKVIDIINNSSALKYKGTITFAEIPTEDLSQGDVYNISDEFVTNEFFIDGSNIPYPAGMNIAYTGEKWDVLSGVTDLSDYIQSDDLLSLTQEEIDEICCIPPVNRFATIEFDDLRPIYMDAESCQLVIPFKTKLNGSLMVKITDTSISSETPLFLGAIADTRKIDSIKYCLRSMYRPLSYTDNNDKIEGFSYDSEGGFIYDFGKSHRYEKVIDSMTINSKYMVRTVNNPLKITLMGANTVTAYYDVTDDDIALAEKLQDAYPIFIKNSLKVVQNPNKKCMDISFIPTMYGKVQIRIFTCRENDNGTYTTINCCYATYIDIDETNCDNRVIVPYNLRDYSSLDNSSIEGLTYEKINTNGTTKDRFVYTDGCNSIDEVSVIENSNDTIISTDTNVILVRLGYPENNLLNANDTYKYYYTITDEDRTLVIK